MLVIKMCQRNMSKALLCFPESNIYAIVLCTMKSILQVIKEGRPVLFDGAMGTELYKRGVFINRCFEEANLAAPELVLSVHRDYRDAGAEVLTTNSWGAGRYKLARHNLQDRVQEINKQAASLARQVAQDSLYVAGSVGPLGPRLEPVGALSEHDALDAFREQMEALIGGGVDFILLETFGDAAEAAQAVRAARSIATSVPVFASMTIDMSGNPLFGLTLEEAMDRLIEAGADVIGLNCSVGPQPMLRAAKRMHSHRSDIPLLIEPNAGMPRQIEGRMMYMSTPEYFATYTKYYLQEGVRFVGGCCGTTPDHIRSMARTVRQYRAMCKDHDFAGEECAGRGLGDRGPGGRGPSEISGAGKIVSFVPIGSKSGGAKPEAGKAEVERIPFAEKSRLAAKLAGGQMVYSLELVPPSGTTLDTIIDKARIAKQAGIDAINIPDGPRATSRVSTLVTAIMIEQQVGLETILHYTCRDRNLISMQADLLGAHAIGLRNILCITGDPPKLGDYPDATGVFDIDSIGLTRMIYRLNGGFDISGKPIGKPTGLSHGVGVNPGRANFETEMERFRKKIDAGAEWAITQPVFDRAVMEEFLDYIERNGLHISIIMGIWPLSSLKNALFMKNEVPGIEIPDEVIQRMEHCASAESAREEGVAIARELYESLKGSIQGVQLSAPFGRIDLALRVIGK